MAQQCAICKKGSMLVWRRVRLRATKYNPTVKRRQYPNLQWVRLASGQRVKACAKCIKAMSKLKTQNSKLKTQNAKAERSPQAELGER